MTPLIRIITIAGAGLAALWLYQENQSQQPFNPYAPKQLPKPDDTPSRAEMRKVMRHLGKRSGQARRK